MENRMSELIEQGAILRNAFNKETFIFSGPVDDPRMARFDVVLEKGGSGGGNALVHVHPGADEHFTVRTGCIKVVVDGGERIVGPGESAVVPRGRPHYFANAGEGNAEITVEFKPAQQHLRFFANFASMVEKHPEWFSLKGDPNFLLIALTLNTYRDHLYLAGIPPLVQRAIFAALAPIARLRGYRVVIAPQVSADPEGLAS
jgi:mannose-6-phosphate isomerase-like protein (cupin superfamily)